MYPLAIHCGLEGPSRARAQLAWGKSRPIRTTVAPPAIPCYPQAEAIALAVYSGAACDAPHHLIAQVQHV